MTIATFKQAIKTDGNLRLQPNHRKLLYVTRQIDTEPRLTIEQREKLYDWAHDTYGT